MYARVGAVALILGCSGISSWLVACGSNEESKDAGTDATQMVDMGVIMDTGMMMEGGNPMDAGECKMGNRNACLACCTNNHQAGAAVFALAIAACVCQPGKCLDACAPSCTGDAAPTMACTGCVVTSANTKGDGGCQDQIGAACTASKPCQEYFGCTLGCPP